MNNISSFNDNLAQGSSFSRKSFQFWSISLSIFLILAGYLLIYIGGTDIFFSFGCAILSFSCLWHAMYSIWIGNVNIGLTISGQTILWYIWPWIYIPYSDIDPFIIRHSPSELAYNTLFVLVICGISAAASFILPFKMKFNWEKPDFKGGIYVYIYFISTIQVILIWSGYWGYTTAIGVFYADQDPVIIQFIRTISHSVPIFISLVLGWIAYEGKLHKRPPAMQITCLVSCLLVQLVWFTMLGRRTIIVLFILSVIIYLRAKTGGKITKHDIFPAVYLVSISSFIAGLLSYFYLVTRSATTLTSEDQNLTLLDIFSSLELASSTPTSFSSNFVNRPIIVLDSFSIVREQASGILYGWNAISQVLMTIPSIIFPNKFFVIGSTLESLWSERLWVDLGDWSNTLLLESYVDFSYFGFALYSAILSFIYVNINNITIIKSNVVFSNIARFIIIFSVLTVEQTLVGYLSFIRDTLIFCGIAYILPLVTRRSRR